MLPCSLHGCQWYSSDSGGTIGDSMLGRQKKRKKKRMFLVSSTSSSLASTEIFVLHKHIQFTSCAKMVGNLYFLKTNASHQHSCSYNSSERTNKQKNHKNRILFVDSSQAWSRTGVGNSSPRGQVSMQVFVSINYPDQLSQLAVYINVGSLINHITLKCFIWGHQKSSAVIHALTKKRSQNIRW